MPDLALKRALRLLGPLEARIMRAVWSHKLPDPFVVRDVQNVTPELAYTTLMTTLNRLADKGLLTVEVVRGQRAFEYRATGRAEDFLRDTSRRETSKLLELYGDAALAAFAAELESLSPAELQRLRDAATDG